MTEAYGLVLRLLWFPSPVRMRLVNTRGGRCAKQTHQEFQEDFRISTDSSREPRNAVCCRNCMILYCIWIGVTSLQVTFRAVVEYGAPV